MHAIEASGLVKRYGEIQALGGVTFTVEEGETFGFLGPNGAGKTTTIRILTGMTRATGGAAWIFRKDIARETIAAKRFMGIVPETSNVYDDLSAWDNLIFNAELYGVSRPDRTRRAKELLELFELWGRKDSPARGFSKGMKRRLTIAMGLINDPRLLFLDEPTSGLDVQSNLIIRDVIRDLNERGVTVFLTTHNIEEASVTCDRVAIVNKGQIAVIDSPERLKHTIESVQSIEFAFDPPSNDTIPYLENMNGVNEVRKNGDKVRIFSSDPGLIIDQVTAYARERGIRVISVNTFGPSLEDVFIKITGISTRAKEAFTSD
ncbi:MAG: ATP-binding cassette domain-containing protein [Methanoregulaceae archaeon]